MNVVRLFRTRATTSGFEKVRPGSKDEFSGNSRITDLSSQIQTACLATAAVAGVGEDRGHAEIRFRDDLRPIENYPGRRFAHSNLRADVLDLRCLLFELRGQNFHPFLLLRDGGLQFHHFLVLFEELVEMPN